MKSPVIKRTVYIDGRKTQITLEDAFWSTLKEIAQIQGVTVSQVITEIEKSRQGRKPVLRGSPVCIGLRPLKKSRVYRRGKQQAVEWSVGMDDAFPITILRWHLARFSVACGGPLLRSLAVVATASSA
jgi:Ribbon-helix-helix domain